MANALESAISPYLRSHAKNPVAWRQWGTAPFEEARRRGVPVLISIGYSTCHWCHVMARESFSDERIASYLNDNFVTIKVDREEHPDVDATYLAAAPAFTGNLGWPLTVFATPEGRTFYAGTYYPPQPVQGTPSFQQVLDAVLEAWTERRDEVEANAAGIATALRQAAEESGGSDGRPEGSENEGGTPVRQPSTAELRGVATLLGRFEDVEYGGFGGAPKFPVAPVQLFLLQSASVGDGDAGALVSRTLRAMAASPLRDPVEGGFFRYAVRRDWHEPHYERMLYDNAQLLVAYSRLTALDPGNDPAADDADDAEGDPADVAAGIAGFLVGVLQTAEGGFGSAQDSESTVRGARTEGGYYALDAAERAGEVAPAVDEKVLTGWNGLAIGALAEAGARHRRPDWVAAAERAADRILRHHVTPDGFLLRAATSRGVSTAVATLEDYGMLAHGLVRLALATGRAEYATEARRLVDLCLAPADVGPAAFAVPGDGDPVLASHGLALASDPSEGAYPSGLSATAQASYLLWQLTADERYRSAAARAVAGVAHRALDSPMGFGAILALAADLEHPAVQLVVVGPGDDGDLADVARTWFRAGAIAVAVTPEQIGEWTAAGFALFEGRDARPGSALAYVCREFVCRLPTGDVASLRRELTSTTAASSAG